MRLPMENVSIVIDMIFVEGQKTLEELFDGKMVELNFSYLSKFILDFPDNINTLMIQKTFDSYCIVVDDISVRREQECRE